MLLEWFYVIILSEFRNLKSLFYSYERFFPTFEYTDGSKFLVIVVELCIERCGNTTGLQLPIFFTF